MPMLTHVTHVWMLPHGTQVTDTEHVITACTLQHSTVNFAPGAAVRIFAVVIILMSHKAGIYVSSRKTKTPIYSDLRRE